MFAARLTLIVALLVPMLVRAEGAAYRIDEVIPGAKPSYYSEHIVHFVDRWPPPTLSIPNTRPSLVRAIRTPGHPGIVGMVKHFTVRAPLSQVVAIADRIEDYPRIWKDLISVKVLSRDHNRTFSEWTRKAPSFILPKIHYRQVSVEDRSTPGRVVSRSQFIDGNGTNTSDSLAVYESLGPNLTRVSVVNFFEPNYGPFRALVEGKIWRASQENGFKDDVAFIAHIEHPDWSPDRLADEANRALKQYPSDNVEYTDLIKFE